MWYGSTKTLLESIVRQLRIEAPHDDAEWQAQTDLLQTCLAEMTQMSEPVVYALMASRYVHRPVADKLKFFNYEDINSVDCCFFHGRYGTSSHPNHDQR
jgi:hypothetical protein